MFGRRKEQGSIAVSLAKAPRARYELLPAEKTAPVTPSPSLLNPQKTPLTAAPASPRAFGQQPSIAQSLMQKPPAKGHLIDWTKTRFVEDLQPPTNSQKEIDGDRILPLLWDRLQTEFAVKLNRDELATEISPLVGEILSELKINLSRAEQSQLEQTAINDMLGLGPLEPLVRDESVTDIMVNRADQVYVERQGKLVLTDVHFRDDNHVLGVAQRICSLVGRRIDQTSPLADARLADGSRVNIIIPPLALKGPTISIRKFAKIKIDLDRMATQGNLSPQMREVLKIAAACRLNVLISGGTGSGKTTLLNAMSKLIDAGERIVTIEDAAELQLMQPHVVTLETRTANLEGDGAITIRDLVKNALRMRPDRIILGEIRGSECIDLLQAMNTGHDGSMSTLHANRPREALTRMEHMIGMANLNLPPASVKKQIAESLDLIVQVNRMRDGKRRITSITEVVGMEGDVITTQDLFTYQYDSEDSDGNLVGQFVSAKLRPHFEEKARYFGLDKLLMQAML